MTARSIRDGIRGGALACAAAILLGTLAPGAAEAQWHGRRDAGGAVAAGIAGGLLGGLAAGAIIGGAGRPNVYYPPVAEPSYVEPAEPVYVPHCYILRRKVWLDAYAYTYRRERVCE